MSFIKANIQELLEVSRDSSVKVISASLEAHDDEPFYAWITVAFKGLVLHMVRDRDREHIDLECVAEGEAKRWVPLEILAVAAEPKKIKEYTKACHATLDGASSGYRKDWPKCAMMLEQPLSFVAQHAAVLKCVTGDAKAIVETELLIAKETKKLLVERN